MSYFAQLDHFPTEIWERIAYHTASTSLGPPVSLRNLLLTCNNLNKALSHRYNTHLYAALFSQKFDTAAPARRLSQRWLTTGCLAKELIKRFEALKRIRARQFQNLTSDLWTAYLMFLEADGKNEAQLRSFADLRGYLEALVKTRESMWFKDQVVDTLVMWLMWFMIDRDQIRSGIFRGRNYWICLLEMLVAVGYRFPSLHAPDQYFFMPLEDDQELPFVPGSFCPPVTEIIHYGHTLYLAAPLISSAAILNLAAQGEALQVEANLPIGSNEHIREFHLRNRIATTSQQFSSQRNDQDWYRLVSCYTPYIKANPLRGTVYQLGSLSGSWAGRYMSVDRDLFMALLIGTAPSDRSRVLHRPLYWELREHYCLYPNEPLSLGLTEDGQDDVHNAFVPLGTKFNPTHDGLEVFDPITGHTSRYETFSPDATAPYSKAAHEKVQRTWISDAADREIAEETLLEPALASTSPSTYASIDDDDEYSDTVSHLSSGVSDILITGTVSAQHAQVWGGFTLYGRVRPWDGLVVLYRYPTNPNDGPLGHWVLKGYIHDRNLAGRWRETSTDRQIVGYEGAFVATRTQPVRH